MSSPEAIPGIALVGIPELTLSPDPSEYPADILKFFREVWHANGYAHIKTPHSDVLTLPTADDTSPIALHNSYSGLTDGEVLDRKPYLKEYRRQRKILSTISDSPARTEQEKKLGRILDHIPDRGGIQGVETYKLFLPARNRLVVSRQHTLGPERTTYDLPLKKGGLPIYPHLGKTRTTLHYDLERFDADRTADGAYLKVWHDIFGLIVPALKAR